MRTRLILLVSVAYLLGAATMAVIWFASGYFPGTFARSRDGVPRGTGNDEYYNTDGALVLRERYVAGILEYSTWFEPDGTVIHSTDWRHENGVGLYLHDDGSIRTMMAYRGGLAHGPAAYFAPDGTFVEAKRFINGNEVAADGTVPRGRDPVHP